MFFRELLMKKLILPFGFLALVLMLQPVLVASAAELFVRQNDSGDSSPSLSGKPTLFNTPGETKGQKKMPFRSDTKTFVSNTQKQKDSMKVPSGWKSLSSEMIQNRADDTKNALRLAAKIERKVAADQKARDNGNNLSALDKKHQEFMNKYLKGLMPQEQKVATKASYGYRKVEDKKTISTRKVFNTPSND